MPATAVATASVSASEFESISAPLDAKEVPSSQQSPLSGQERKVIKSRYHISSQQQHLQPLAEAEAEADRERDMSMEEKGAGDSGLIAGGGLIGKRAREPSKGATRCDVLCCDVLCCDVLCCAMMCCAGL
jgi:hypothetical protein